MVRAWVRWQVGLCDCLIEEACRDGPGYVWLMKTATKARGVCQIPATQLPSYPAHSERSTWHVCTQTPTRDVAQPHGESQVHCGNR